MVNIDDLIIKIEETNTLTVPEQDIIVDALAYYKETFI